MNAHKRVKEAYFIDTNVFLRAIVRDKNVKKMEESKVFLELVRLGKINAFTSSMVFAEVNWVLSSTYKLLKQQIIQYLVGIINLKNLRFDDNYNPAETLRLWNRYPIKFVDCLIASNPRILQGDIIVVSYDRDFDKIEGIIRKEPNEVIQKFDKNFQTRIMDTFV